MAYREAAQYGQPALVLALQGVVVGILGVEQRVYLRLHFSRGVGLLQAHDVGIAVGDILHHDIGAVHILVGAVAPHVVRHHLDGALGCRAGDVEGTVGAYGREAYHHSHKGDDGVEGLEEQPEYEESEIEKEEDGEDQRCIGKPRRHCGVDIPRISRGQHRYDGCHIGAGNHLQHYLGYRLRHIYLPKSKRRCFSSAVRLS